MGQKTVCHKTHKVIKKKIPKPLTLNVQLLTQNPHYNFRRAPILSYFFWKCLVINNASYLEHCYLPFIFQARPRQTDPPSNHGFISHSRSIVYGRETSLSSSLIKEVYRLYELFLRERVPIGNEEMPTVHTIRSVVCWFRCYPLPVQRVTK